MDKSSEKARYGRFVNNSRGYVVSVICPVCNTKLDAYEEKDDLFYVVCPKCKTKVWNVNYLIEKEG